MPVVLVAVEGVCRNDEVLAGVRMGTAGWEVEVGRLVSWSREEALRSLGLCREVEASKASRDGDARRDDVRGTGSLEGRGIPLGRGVWRVVSSMFAGMGSGGSHEVPVVLSRRVNRNRQAA